jgi:3-phytase
MIRMIPRFGINESDPERSLIIGTDKDEDGALFVFDLKGKVIDSLSSTRYAKRPNNVDVSYGLRLGLEKSRFRSYWRDE